LAPFRQVPQLQVIYNYSHAVEYVNFQLGQWSHENEDGFQMLNGEVTLFIIPING